MVCGRVKRLLLHQSYSLTTPFNPPGETLEITEHLPGAETTHCQLIPEISRVQHGTRRDGILRIELQETRNEGRILFMWGIVICVKLQEMNSHHGEAYLFLNCLRRKQATMQAEALPSLTFCIRETTNRVCVYRESKKLAHAGTSLAAQCITMCLPVQGTQVQSLVWKISHAAEQLSLCTTISEVRPHTWSPCSTTRGATAMRALSPQQRLAPICHN